MTSQMSFAEISDYSGGLVTNVPTMHLQPNQSPELDNINLLNRGFQKRRGDTAFNTAMNSGADVQGLTYYKPVSGVEYLVAVAGDKIFKTDALDGTMDDISAALTVTANQNNIWTFCKLNDLCIGVGGAPDAPFKWSGTGTAALLDDSPPSGKFCFQMRDRVFIGGPTAAPSTLYWSKLSDATDWTAAGSGNTAVVTNDGDTLVGGIPLNNNTALLFKNYSIHHLVVETSPFPVKLLTQGIGCCGKNAMVNVDGIIYFITNEPRMKATDGYSIINFPNTIDDLWDGLNRSRLQYIQGIYYAKLRQIHWYCSDGSATSNDLCLIWDIDRKCWLRYTTGYACNVAAIASGYKLYGGHTDGIIYEKDVASTFSDASETSPGTINAYWRSPWLSFGNLFKTKHLKYIDLICETKDDGQIEYSWGYNYNADTNSGAISQTSSGGKWDVDTWGDTFIWGGESYKQQRIELGGNGNTFQIKLFNSTVDEDMEINSISLAVKETGVADINR